MCGGDDGDDNDIFCCSNGATCCGGDRCCKDGCNEDGTGCKGECPSSEKKTYSGSIELKTDENVYFTLTQSGQTVTLTYLDTGPHGEPHCNTNCEGKSHVVETRNLPEGYVVVLDSIRGTSGRDGCVDWRFTNSGETATICYDYSWQYVTISYKYDVCPVKEGDQN